MTRRIGIGLLLFAAGMAVLPACRGGDAASTSPPPDAMPSEALPSQDRLPPPMDAVKPDDAPFATTARRRVAIREWITRTDEPVDVGSIGVPEHWRITERSDVSGPQCDDRARCVMWEAISPDGAARIMLLLPHRRIEQLDKTSGESPQGRIAQNLLRESSSGPEWHGVVTGSGAQAATMAATRKGWLTGGAWLSVAHDAHGTRMQDFMAIDVETRPADQRRYRVQTGPMLILRMPADRFDLKAADALWRSLRLEAAWLPQWWLAWETRTIQRECTLGYHRGECHVRAGPHADYFRSGDSLGLWDTRSDTPYASPEEETRRYDR